jgi:hypothetical protein
MKYMVCSCGSCRPSSPFGLLRSLLHVIGQHALAVAASGSCIFQGKRNPHLLRSQRGRTVNETPLPSSCTLPAAIPFLIALLSGLINWLQMLFLFHNMYGRKDAITFLLGSLFERCGSDVTPDQWPSQSDRYTSPNHEIFDYTCAA